MTSVNQLYPFSTAEHSAIPLDVIRPLAFKKQAVPFVGTATITIPADWEVATFFSPEGCLIEFNAATLPNPPVDDTEYANVLFVPANNIVTSTVIPGEARIVSLGSVDSYVIAQQVQKWAALALEMQLKRR